jgi:uncharacterized protein YndB with AHSA1/START domain
MLTTAVSESVTRAPEDVFVFIADVRNDPRWHTDVLEARLIDGAPVGKHARFEIRTKPFMGISGGTVTVTHFDPPTRIVFDVSMEKMRPTTTFTIVADGGGTRVTRQVVMEPFGLLRLMAPFLGGMMSRRNAGFLANLKRVLESEAPPA